MGSCYFLVSEQERNKEVGYEGAELIAPAIKAAPSNSPHALAVVRHRFSAVIEIVAVRYNTDPKDM